MRIPWLTGSTPYLLCWLKPVPVDKIVTLPCKFGHPIQPWYDYLDLTWLTHPVDKLYGTRGVQIWPLSIPVAFSSFGKNTHPIYFSVHLSFRFPPTHPPPLFSSLAGDKWVFWLTRSNPRAFCFYLIALSTFSYLGGPNLYVNIYILWVFFFK